MFGGGVSFKHRSIVVADKECHRTGLSGQVSGPGEEGDLKTQGRGPS